MSVGDPTQPALDTSQGLVSALGGQDVHALEFTGAEIMPTVQGTSLILQDGDEANPDGGPVSWASHPSAIGYRRAGYVSSGSGSGSGGLGGGGGGSGGGSGSGSGSGGGFTTLTAVSPEFDSGMNDGTDGEELDRLQNFYGGTQENPTAAQSAPTPRAQVQVSGTSSGAGMQGSSPGHEPTMTPFFNPETDHGHYNPFVGWLWPFGGGSASGGSQGNAPSTSTTLDYGSPGNSTGTQTMPDPGPPSAPEGAPGGGGGSKAQGPPPGPSPGPGPNSNSNVDPLTALAILAVLSKGSQVNPNPQSNVGPPQPGSVIGPIAPDPYADYIPFSDGQETYLVPPDSVVAVPGRGMIQGATVIHIPGYEEKVARGINIFGAVAGLAGNAVEATGAFFLAITPEPTLLTKVGAGALGVLAADGAQANVRTLWNLGDPTPTMLNQGVTRAAGSVMSPEAARYVGVGTDLATHAGANSFSLYKISSVLGAVAAPAASTPKFYSVAFQTTLDSTQLGLSRPQHFQIANEALEAARALDPDLAAFVRAPGSWGRPPVDWAWQHATIAQGDGVPGVLQLVPKSQHTNGSLFWRLFHPLPGGAGGYAEWAIPAGAPPN